LRRIRGKIEDLAEGVVELRRGQTADFDEEVGQMLARGPGSARPEQAVP